MSDETKLITDDEWDKYRYIKGYIDLERMYRDKNKDKIPDDIQTQGTRYLNSISMLKPITSRQVAAVAFTTAAMFDVMD